MITRHHIALTILCTMILCSALVPPDPVIILIIYAGAAIGAILPDIQMKKPRIFRTRTIAWMVSRFSSSIFTPIICRLYRNLWGRTCDPLDKRLTHSVPGILFLSMMSAGILLVPTIILTGSSAMNIPMAFFCSILLGLVLHQTEDMCTYKGITPLFPFSTMTIAGSIRPCDTADRRIAQFHFYHCSMAGIILGFQYLGGLHGVASVPICLFGLCSCRGMMIWSSDIRISREYTGDPVPKNPYPDPAGSFHRPVENRSYGNGTPEGSLFFNKNEQ
jgi:membrane-bound metal-dependent hydrolase YbcI (DUF457 family)